MSHQVFHKLEHAYHLKYLKFRAHICAFANPSNKFFLNCLPQFKRKATSFPETTLTLKFREKCYNNDPP